MLLLHVGGSGAADPGSGVPRSFINQHIAGSPATVTVDGRGQGEQGGALPLCSGRRKEEREGRREGGAAGGAGRWVHRDVCRWGGGWCEGVGSERFDAVDVEWVRADPWVWVPYTCVLRPYSAAQVRFPTSACRAQRCERRGGLVCVHGR
eukprot:59075-Rhodomonas_salina.3